MTPLAWKDGNLRLMQGELCDTTLDLVQAMPRWAPGFKATIALQEHVFMLPSPYGPFVAFSYRESHN